MGVGVTTGGREKLGSSVAGGAGVTVASGVAVCCTCGVAVAAGWVSSPVISEEGVSASSDQGMSTTTASSAS